MKPEHDYALEAEAIALAVAGQVHDNEDARCVETLAKQLVLTALLSAEGRGMEKVLGDLTGHELYRYRPKAFDGFIEYVRQAARDGK